MANCVTTPTGQDCIDTTDYKNCRPWDITQQPKTNCYVDNIQQETLGIAGANVNVFKLLGVHEQTKLVDLVGNGTALSGGDRAGFPATNAFSSHVGEWQSKQTGSDAILASAYIGYDFGVLKIPGGRQMYGVDASVRYHITSIKIKQSSNSTSRISKARVERSENGQQWYGVAVVTLPNDDNLNTISFKNSVPNRYWRLRPLAFYGESCDSWGVQALEFHDYMATHWTNIQDKIFMENRNRDYATDAVGMKGYYDLLTTATDLSKFGIDITPTATYQIKVNFSNTVALLGRPIVIGDIIELPSETQYTPDLTPIKRWLEVTDVTWDPASYTPGWLPTMLLITAQPAMASEETQDIFGDLAKTVDSSGLFDNDDGNNSVYQDYSTVEQTIDQQAKTEVPEWGAEGSNEIREFTDEEVATAQQEGVPHLSKYGFNRTGLYVEDAIPQNDAPYTEGPEFPTSPADSDYHRMTYLGLAKDVPARLYRWSSTKGRWIYLETDRRAQYNEQQAVLKEYLTSTTKKPATDVASERE